MKARTITIGSLGFAKVSLILALETFDFYTGRNINPHREETHGGSY